MRGKRIERRIFLAAIALFAIVALYAGQVEAAASDSSNASINFNVASRAKITFQGGSTVTFTDADPDTSANVTSTVTVRVNARTGSTSNVTVALTGANLTDGTSTINASNVGWSIATCTTGSGTLSTLQQTIATFTGSGSRNCDVTFSLTNSWDYYTGNYSATFTFDVSVP